MFVSGLIKFAFFYIAFVVIRSLISEYQKTKKQGGVHRAPADQYSKKSQSSNKDTFEAEYRVIK